MKLTNILNMVDMLTIMVYKIFNKKTKSSVNVNEDLAEELKKISD